MGWGEDWKGSLSLLVGLEESHLGLSRSYWTASISAGPCCPLLLSDSLGFRHGPCQGSLEGGPSRRPVVQR